MVYYIVKSPYFSVSGAVTPWNNMVIRESTLKLGPGVSQNSINLLL